MLWKSLAPAAGRQQRRSASTSDAANFVATELRRRERAAGSFNACPSHIDGLVAVPASGAFHSVNWATSERRRDAADPQARRLLKGDRLIAWAYVLRASDTIQWVNRDLSRSER